MNRAACTCFSTNLQLFKVILCMRRTLGRYAAEFLAILVSLFDDLVNITDASLGVEGGG